MVLNCNKVGILKEVETRSKDAVINQVDLVAILEGQAKMQQEFTEFKKCSADEMKAMRQENSRLKRKIKMNVAHNGKEKEVPKLPCAGQLKKKVSTTQLPIPSPQPIIHLPSQPITLPPFQLLPGIQ